MKNLEIYEKYRAVPESAQKEIKGGRLKGMTDINPMWRIKCLTEQFGPCGIGWVAPIKQMWLANGHGDEIVANVEVGLKYFDKESNRWSEEIPGIGGSMFVANERSGPYTSDEAFKMAYTDALSVACKALGFGADVYWEKDRSKYTKKEEATIEGEDAAEWLERRRVKAVEADMKGCLCEICGAEIVPYPGADGKMVSAKKHISASRQKYNQTLCISCIQKL